MSTMVNRQPHCLSLLMLTGCLYAQLPRLISQRQLELEMERLNLKLPPDGNVHHLIAPLDHQHLRLLLSWTAIVCQQYGCLVTNFATSFASGKAICILVRPCYLLQASMPPAGL